MIKQIKKNKCFGGLVEYYSHASSSTKTEMKFSVFLPQKANSEKVPVLFWLSGLTCTEENFMTKAGAQQYANREGIMIVCPDTSPRGTDIEGEHESWDFGSGAGFYLNATTEAWKNNYRMYDYIVKELPQLIAENFSADIKRLSISGHSMGGHGALVIGLRNPNLFKSISAFAPICHPVDCPWGQKAFTHYLGEDQKTWEAYDATLLITKGAKPLPLLVDQGTNDEFLAVQLKTNRLKEACEQADFPAEINLQQGYDHSYYFISTFIEKHIHFHSRYLHK